MNNLSRNYCFNRFYKKNTKPFSERERDWICPECKNLNFAFRTQCNRCKRAKEDKDVIKINKQNEEKNQVTINEEKGKKINEKKEIEGKKIKKEKFQNKENDCIETKKAVVEETKKPKKNKNKKKKGYKKYYDNY